MKLKIFMIFALINILIPINASAETIINGNFKNISINDELSNEYITTIFYVSIILVFCIYVFNYVKILQHLVNKKTMKLNNQLEENKRLSEEIIDKEKFKNNYFINLSHELRIPINVINSTVQLINLLNVNKNITYKKT